MAGRQRRHKLTIAGDVLRQRSFGVLDADAGGGPVADLEAGVKDEIGWAALEAGLAVLALVILAAVAGVGVQLVTGACNMTTLTNLVIVTRDTGTHLCDT